MKILISGAGIGGLAAARALLADGHEVTVLERAAARHDGSALDGFLLALAHHHLGRVDEAATQARRSLAMARELGYPAREAQALTELSNAVSQAGDIDGAVQLARQAGQITADIPGWISRVSRQFLTACLTDAGDLPAAERTCAEGWPGAGRRATCGAWR